MGEVVTQTVTFEKWPSKKQGFEDEDDLFACLKDLVRAGYVGQVRMPTENGNWDLEVNVNDTAMTAVFGQCVVSLGEAVEAMTIEQYEARFGKPGT